MPCFQQWFVGLIVAWVLALESANAFTYVMMRDADLLAQSDAVISGQVVSIIEARSTNSATAYSVQADEIYKGRPAEQITLIIPGVREPRSGGLWISGAPHLAEGERALLFLSKSNEDYRLQQFALGSFRIVSHQGKDYAVRDLRAGEHVDPGVYTEPSNVRDLQKFAAWLHRQENTVHPRRGASRSDDEADYFVTDSSLKSRINGDLIPRFTLFESNGMNMRWRGYDSGGSVNWHHNGGGVYVSQIDAALEAWTSDSGSRIALNLSGSTGASAGFTSPDGYNTILFGDPNNEITGSFDCSRGGVLGIGGPWFGGTHQYQNDTYWTISEGEVIIQNGAECWLDLHSKKNAAELIGHEVGHAQGFGHSCGDSNSGNCDGNPPGDSQALMRAYAHGDGRGASLGQDDRAAAAFLYFQPTPNRTLTVTLPTGGTITTSGINCGSGGSDCSQSYTDGTSVTLTATPDSGWSFDAWGDDCANALTSSCNLTMNGDKIVSVAFAPLPDYYTDVPDTHPAHDAITNLSVANIIAGCDETRFCPSQPLDRATMAQWLLSALEGGSYLPPAPSGLIFNDVAVDDFNADWIEALATRNLTEGCTADGSRYCPSDLVSRASLSALLLKTLFGSAYSPSSTITGVFDDVGSGDFNAVWIEDLWFQGITDGCDANRFCPNQPITRAEGALWLYRAFGP